MCNLTKLTTESSWYFWSAVFIWYCRLSTLCHCTRLFQCCSLSNVLDKGLSSFLHISGLSINVFLPPPPLVPFPSPSPLLTQCYECLEDCVGNHSWAASHGILSRGWLVTMETPEYPKHSSSIQHNAVVHVDL